MKPLYYIILLIAIIVIAYFIISSLNKKEQSDAQANQTVKPKENPYQGLRNQILNLNPADINIDLPIDKEMVFGVVMEISATEGTATIVSLSTGDASMYTSTGGGIIGGSEHENVKKAAIDFVNTSQSFFSKMDKANLDLPKPGDIKFFILTNKGRYAFESSESDITKKGSAWADLFSKGNDVITQLRLSSK